MQRCTRVASCWHSSKGSAPVRLWRSGPTRQPDSAQYQHTHRVASCRRSYFSPIHPILTTRVPKPAPNGHAKVQLQAKNVTIHCYGVLHDHPGYVRYVDNSIRNLRPNVVAVEYNIMHSLYALSVSSTASTAPLHEHAPLLPFGTTTTENRLDDTCPKRLALFEQYLVKHLNLEQCLRPQTEPVLGTEMLTSMAAAQAVGAHVWLLDQDEWLQESRQACSGRKLKIAEQYFVHWLYRTRLQRYTAAVEDRQEHMVNGLLCRLSQQHSARPHSTIALVCGLGHIPGLQQKWNQRISSVDGHLERETAQSHTSLQQTSALPSAGARFSLTEPVLDLLLEKRCAVPSGSWQGYSNAWKLFSPSFSPRHVMVAYSDMVERADQHRHIRAMQNDSHAQSLDKACRVAVAAAGEGATGGTEKARAEAAILLWDAEGGGRGAAKVPAWTRRYRQRQRQQQQV